jgi:3-oxoacyl-[acyl-carrier-protein] synthase-3
MDKPRASITGVQGWVPEKKLTNADLEKLVDTNDEWIVSRTGIRERRILDKKGEGVTYMAERAAKQLLEKTNTSAEEIDLIIFATVTPDMVFPASANIVAHKIGANNAFGYDINAACSEFIYSIATASKFIETRSYEKIIVVGADKMSAIVDYEDRATCVLFGDGAGAVLLEPDTRGNGIIDSILKSDGSGWKHLHQKAGGSKRPTTHQTVENREHYVYQEGKAVFKVAVNNMADVATKIMNAHDLSSDDVTWLVPHQANKRIIDATGQRMGITPEKVMINIDRYGNTTNASIPLCLWEWEHRMKQGDHVILAAFGGGFTWGAVYLKWAYNSKNVND